MFKLLLLTAQRRDEVGGARWPEIDLDKRLWTIPRERAKNDWAHEVHLSELALEILSELPKISRSRADGAGSEPSPYLFTTSGERPVSGFSKAKERLDGHCSTCFEWSWGKPAETRMRRSSLGSCTTFGARPQPAWLGSTSRRTSSTAFLIMFPERSAVSPPSTTGTLILRSANRRSKRGAAMSRAWCVQHQRTSSR
jgi:Phage integrase family